MNSPKYILTVLLFLVVQSQCGVIDNIYERVKNTTSGLKQDVKNVFSYGKGVIGLEDKHVDLRPSEERRGLIGGLVHSTADKVRSIRDYFWNPNPLSEDAGVFGNMYNRVASRVVKIKGSKLGGNQITTIQPPSEKTKMISDTLNKLFFGNGTRLIEGKAFQEAIEKLRKKLEEIRNNVTVTESPEHHGEGLIDLRTAA